MRFSVVPELNIFLAFKYSIPYKGPLRGELSSLKLSKFQVDQPKSGNNTTVKIQLFKPRHSIMIQLGLPVRPDLTGRVRQ